MDARPMFPRPMFPRLFPVLLLACVLLLPAAGARAVTVDRVVSPGGIEAWLVQDHTNPIIALRLAFRGGAALDPDDRQGLARMVAGLVDEGAGDLDSRTFQGILNDRSITLNFEAGRETFGGEMQTLTDRADLAFKLLGLALTQPRFDAEPVERIRQQILVNLKRADEQPSSIADNALMGALFPGHPYGRPSRGTAQGLAAVTVDDLRAFAANRFARDNLVIGVTGDITPERLAALLDEHLGALPAKATPWTLPDVAPDTGQAGTIVIRKPVPQSAITFAQPGLKRDDPDYYAAAVLNQILGGSSFTSRLYTEVREKRGLAYSVYTQLYPMDHAALLVGDAGTANARVKETLHQVRTEWERLATQGVTDEELADTKTYLTGSFPLRFTANDRIARMLVAVQLDDLGIDYFDRRNDLIAAVSKEDVNRLARRLLDPKRLVFVVVGEPEGLARLNQ
ncbi:MAG: insulinase family protein [Rhodobacterales bacterium]|nr:insulinase family protein [Rhodobacterales bacterium]